MTLKIKYKKSAAHRTLTRNDAAMALFFARSDGSFAARSVAELETDHFAD
jgi:hypothetical protein